MASLKCIIPDCKNQATEEIKRMSDERIQSAIRSSIEREDKINERLNSLQAEGVILACHRICVSFYTTCQHDIQRHVRKRKQVEEKDNSVEKRTHQSILSDI